MTWRREDYGYAAATIAAAVLVAYLIAGNFGLVPSPLGRGRSGGLPEAEVAALTVANPPPRTLPVVAIAAAPALPEIARHDVTPPAAPAVVIDTKSGSTVKLVQNATVVGRVLAAAGVKDVVVQFKSASGGVTSAVASTSCTNANKCSWSVPVPATIGTYSVTATAADKIQQTAKSNTITLSVINPGAVVGGVVKGVGSTVGGVVSTVQQAPELLGNVLATLLGTLHL